LDEKPEVVEGGTATAPGTIRPLKLVSSVFILLPARSVWEKTGAVTSMVAAIVAKTRLKLLFMCLIPKGIDFISPI
jgi:hypothetical protein